MNTLRAVVVTVLVTTGIFIAVPRSSSVLFAQRGSKATANDQNALLRAFAAIGPIDAHIHIYKDDLALDALVEHLNLRMLNICVIDDRDPFGKGLEPQRSDVLKVRHSTGGRAAFCTTFSPYDFEQPGFREKTIHQLDQDFANGAVAVKIYKVMGMEMKSKTGKWVMADDPAFEPIYQDIAAHNRTLVAHLAEPDSCWQAPNPASPDYDYYKEHPEEYAYAHPDWPSKVAILAARDHLVAENPKLRVVGAHLGSMESDVDQMAERFDRYPNFAVDMAARVPYFMLQPRAKVRAFLIKYQDRLLYATDLVVMPEGKTEETLEEFRSTYARDWKFFSTEQTVEYMGHSYQGLALPKPVLRKLFHDNAVHWFPGILGPVASQGRDDRADEGTIQRLIAKYAQSIDEASTALGAEIWATSPDVSFIYPLGYERGWEQVKRNIYERAMGEMFSERKLTPQDISVHVYGDAAWAEFRWHFVARLRKDGSTVQTDGRETQIYHKSPDRRWVLVHVHYSTLPVAGESQGP